MPGRRSTSAPPPAPDTVGDVIRWAVFSCALVPVVLIWYGTSPAGAAGAALGLAGVTAACRYLLRRSERCAQRYGCDGEGSGVQRGGRHTRRQTPVD
ncbi:hypothetical protein SRB17_02440 [Streptomyces sp. RB17]|uniref:hypothetical protein n=1 Tax=Streptomyces sp. RB17 TaxID=2585197 RepID=UPI0012980853|nr:hypothetical protein [Streptomyces sp. RB17]MQY32296.1 hypothetical protein [Streptomyces sp. RB17]